MEKQDDRFSDFCWSFTDGKVLKGDGRTALALAGQVNLRAGDTVLVEAAGGWLAGVRSEETRAA